MRDYTGQITIDSASPSHAAEYGWIGYCPQTLPLLPWKTVYENVMLPLTINSSNNAISKERQNFSVHQALTLCKIEHAAKFYPDELSQGMKARCCIARTLVAKPRLVVLDEPFSSLDLPLKEMLYMELQTIFKESGVTVVITTHDLTETMVLADYVYVLSCQSNSGSKTQLHKVEVTEIRPRNIDFLLTGKAEDLWKELYNLLTKKT